MVRSIMNRTHTPATRQVAPQLPQFTPLSRVIDQFFNDDPFFALAPVTFSREAQSGMALDFGEDQNSYIVKASLPGFTQNDITCEVNEGVLTIKAERAEEQEDSNQTWHRRERRWGSMVRQIQLPAPVVEDQAHAELVNGVLTLRLPKVQKAPARKITINGGSTNSESRGENVHTVNGSSHGESRASRTSGNPR